MRGKNVIAALLVILFSVALAVGITFIVASGNSLDLTIQTPDPAKTGQVSVTLAIGQPLKPNTTPTPLPNENCTFPIDVWVKYPDAWKIETYRIGSKTYTKKEMLDILRGNSSDVRGRLLTQIFVVVLNQRNGADATNIRSAFSEAIDWVDAFPPGSTPSDGDLQKANSIATTLTSFNNGSLGPQTCQFELAPVAPVTQSGGLDLATPTGTLTVTSVRPTPIPPTATFQPKEPARRQPTKAPTPVPPSPLPPTSIPPTATSDLPTPVPTTPPNNPTDPPAPTTPADTPVPPTVAATQPPLPTQPPAPTSVPPTAAPATSVPPTSPPPTAAATKPPPIINNPTNTPKPPKKTPKPAKIPYTFETDDSFII